jgi:segregation and condensation protein A
MIDLDDTSATEPTADDGFTVRLENFEGPFDLLLSLIGRRQLDITEVALSQVTDEFIQYITANDWDLGKTTEFLVVAATLLDLKAARLLPTAEVEDEDDVALLEARDLLFARLLQYRAYKLSAAHLAELLRRAARRYPRVAELDPRFAALMPDVLLDIGPTDLAKLAAAALRAKPAPVIPIDHVHMPRISVREHSAILATLLRAHPHATFRQLVADCTTTLEIVARFLGVLELYRDGSVAFDQAAALTELRVRWTGPARGAVATAADEEEYEA